LKDDRFTKRQVLVDADLGFGGGFDKQVAAAKSDALKELARSFKLLDLNGDGQLSWDEIHVGFPDVTREEFESMDADHSEAISFSEFLVCHNKLKLAAKKLKGMPVIDQVVNGDEQRSCDVLTFPSKLFSMF
jgi:hypothetical protein